MQVVKDYTTYKFNYTKTLNVNYYHNAIEILKYRY